MHTFVVVQVNPGRSLSPAVAELLDDTRATDVPFTAENHLHWQDPSGRLHFAGWQTGSEQLGIGDRWEVRSTGLTAFTGRLWLGGTRWTAGKSWASQMADEFERRSLRSRPGDIEGVGTIVSLSTDGEGTVTADPLGIGILYVAETPEMTVIGSRASIVARVAAEGAKPTPDVHGAGWLAFSHCIHSELTTFEGVSVLPQGSIMELSTRSTGAVRTWAAMPWFDGSVLDTQEAIDSAIDASITHLRALVRVHLSVPTWRSTFELTGGRDSRIVLALLLAEGLEQDVQCITWGAPTLPDVVIAAEMAERFDLEHRTSSGRRSPVRRKARASSASVEPVPRIGPTPDPMSLVEQYRHQVWLASGALSIWDPVRNPRKERSPSISLTGLLGEALRTDYPRTNGLRTSSDLEAFVRSGRFGFDAAGVLTTDARNDYEKRLIDLIESKRTPGGDVRDAIDGFYQSERMRRWCGTTQENDARSRVFPLYSLKAFRTAFALGPDLRRAEYLAFEIVRRCNDDLATFGFVNGAWPASLAEVIGRDGRYPFEEHDATSAAPRSELDHTQTYRRPNRIRKDTAPSPRTVVAAARAAESAEKIDLFRELVDLSPDHRFFDLVDRRELHQAITDIPRLTSPALKSLHDAVTVAIWLNGDAERARSSQL